MTDKHARENSQQPTRETATGGASRVVGEYGWARLLAEGWRVSAKSLTSRKEREKWGTRPVPCVLKELQGLLPRPMMGAIEPAHSSGKRDLVQTYRR